MRIQEQSKLSKGKATSSIIGMPIYSLETGRRIGQVKDVIFDSEQSKLTGLSIEKPGFFSPERIVLKFEDIKSIGRDAVMVESGRVFVRPEDIPRARRALKQKKSITDKTVVTESGNKLGRVGEVLIDEKTGEAVGYEVSHGVAGDIGGGRDYMPAPHAKTVGVDAVIVPDETEKTLQEQESGGLAGAYASAKEKGADYYERAGKYTREQEIEQSRGNKAGYDVRDDEGNLIVAKDQTITDSVIDEAVLKNKMHQVALAAGAGGMAAGYERAGEKARGTQSAWEEAKKRASETWSNLTDSTQDVADKTGRKKAISAHKDFLKGKVAAEDVKDEQGNVILKSGEVITPLILDTLDRQGKLEQVKVKPGWEMAEATKREHPEVHVILESPHQHEEHTPSHI